MRKFTSIRKSLATLLTICLVVTLGFNNPNITQAETGVETTQKTLLQCDEDWTVFKYTVEEGAEPKFEVMYKGQTQEQLEGNLIKTKIFVKNFDSTSPYTPIADGGFNVNIGETLPSIYEKKDFLVCFYVVDTNNYREQARSNYFSFYEEDFHMNYWDLGEGYEYADWRPIDETGKFEVKIKFSEHLQGDISVNVASDVLSDLASDDDERNNLLGKNPIENISYQNYSEEKTIGGESYTMDYSLVSFEISALEQVYGIEDGYTLVKYIVNFNNAVSSTGAEIKPLIFNVDTPMVYDPELYDPTIDEPTTEYVEPTTEYVQPTTEELTTVEPTTEYVEPTTKYVEPTTTQKVEPTTKKVEPTTQAAKKYVTKFKIKGKKTVKVGKKLKLKVALTPKKAKYQKIKWSVSKKKYAKISQKGVLTPKKAGRGKTVTVKVTITNTKKKIKGVKKTLTKKFKVKIK